MAADGAPSGVDLHHVLDTLSGAMIVIDAEDRVSFCNAEFRRSFASPARSARGAWVGRFGGEAIDALALQMADPVAFRRRARSLVDAREFAFEHVAAADGRVFERDYLPIVEDGTYRGHVWQYWDVTAQQAALRDRERLLRAEIAAQQLGVHALRSRAVEAEAEGQDLAERNRLLLETDLLRKELLATASHELRSPLISILNFSHMLADDAADAAEDGTETDDVAMFSSAITRNASRLLDLVDDLLLVARLDAGARTFDGDPVDLSAVVDNAVLDAVALGRPDGVTVRSDITPGIVGRGDTAALARAIANILTNAVKYSHRDGTVDVALRGAADRIELVVTDAGIGIPADEMGALFGQFFRASTARVSGRPGTGLGLAIVRSIAEQHDGTIRLTSRVGEGTTATLSLPTR